MPKSSTVLSTMRVIARALGGSYLAAFERLTDDQLSKLPVLVKIARARTLLTDDYLFTIKVKEERIYDEEPWLVQIVPSCFSVICRSVPGSADIIPSCWIVGPEKFGGLTPTTDLSEIREAARKGQLEVTAEDQEDGEPAFCKFYRMTTTGNPLTELFVLAGSKNSRSYLPLGYIPEYVASERRMKGEEASSAEELILLDVYKNYKELIKLIPPPAYGQEKPGESAYTLCGEFLGGDENAIIWWGLSDNGKMIDPGEFYARAIAAGVKTVKHKILMSRSTSSVEALDRILNSETAGEGKGEVLYFRYPTESQYEAKIVLFKKQTAWYRMLRFLCQQYLSSGFDCLEDLAACFIDYHRLCTEKCSSTYALFVRFLVWMGEKKGYSKAHFSSTRFTDVWREFLAETGEKFTVEPADFGEFKPEFFLSIITEIGDGPGFVRNYSPLAKVVFMQAVQGTGKSTTALEMVRKYEERGETAIVVEQDWFHGCGQTTLSWIKFQLKHGPADWVIIARCNACPDQYQHFLAPIQALGHRCYFIEYNHGREWDYARALRSCVVDCQETTGGSTGVSVVRDDVPPEALIKFISINMACFTPHPEALSCCIYNEPSVEEVMHFDEITRIWEEWKPLIETRKGKISRKELTLAERMVNLGEYVRRMSPARIAEWSIGMLDRSQPVRPFNKVLYTGFFLPNRDEGTTRTIGRVMAALMPDGPPEEMNFLTKVMRGCFTSKKLDEALGWGRTDDRYRIHTSHVTEHFLNGKPVPETAVPLGDKVKIVLTHAVMRGRGEVPDGVEGQPGAIAVRVRVYWKDKLISGPDAHITILVPENGKAGDSRGIVTCTPSPETGEEWAVVSTDEDRPLPDLVGGLPPETVRVVALKPPLKLEAVSIWKAKSR